MVKALMEWLQIRKLKKMFKKDLKLSLNLKIEILVGMDDEEEYQFFLEHQDDLQEKLGYATKKVIKDFSKPKKLEQLDYIQ
jgi:hypothetical protein